ncbi:MAG: 1-(5-phosphoribosyl)-5-[(5-phosphoribosylamino)methylideneamino]imidazole-4-carboxamide isomerase [Pirellulaceae bacterium]
MQVWPAIDIRGGRCVRLAQGDYDRETVYDESPVVAAQRWIDQGAERLHLVDLDGARGDSNLNADAICEIIRSVKVSCQVGGGIRSSETIDRFLDAGALQLVCGTRATTDRDWLHEITHDHPSRIVVGIDARHGKVAVQGWTEITNILAMDMAQDVAQLPIAGIVYTDISRDGLLTGPNFDAMQEMQTSLSVPVIASGGVAELKDLTELARRGLCGCIVGRALYEGRFSIEQANAAAARLTAEGRTIV